MNEQLLNALVAMIVAAIPIVSGFATLALRKIALRNGVDLDQQRLVKLNSMLVNGMNLAAAEAKQARSLPPGVDLKTFIINQALDYVTVHGKETLDAIGTDPNGAKDREGLTARAETLIADPTQPTPAVLDAGKQGATK